MPLPPFPQNGAVILESNSIIAFICIFCGFLSGKSRDLKENILEFWKILT